MSEMKILVVDDEAKIVEVLKAYLEQAGFEVATASDGASALAAARDDQPDLAVLDIMLPGMDGLEITKTLQKELGTPVILLTAKSDEVDRLVGLEIGADDYIVKPFSPREVVARVKAVLRRAGRSAPDSERIEAGGLVVDLGGREVTVDAEPVELTKTEFDILAAMAGTPGRVWTRLQLMQTVSGYAYEGYERTIDAHMKNLRKKLGDDPSEPRWIKTVWGVGYKFDAGA
jgi:DNA-binding response OmpR family regulator